MEFLTQSPAVAQTPGEEIELVDNEHMMYTPTHVFTRPSDSSEEVERRTSGVSLDVSTERERCSYVSIRTSGLAFHNWTATPRASDYFGMNPYMSMEQTPAGSNAFNHYMRPQAVGGFVPYFNYEAQAALALPPVTTYTYPTTIAVAPLIFPQRATTVETAGRMTQQEMRVSKQQEQRASYETAKNMDKKLKHNVKQASVVLQKKSEPWKQQDSGAFKRESAAERPQYPSGTGGMKFLCSFIVGIVDCRSFGVSKRIIGRGGKNMKAISELCPGSKIRLRGRGSGFKEPHTNAESDIPLQVNLSSPNVESYERAKYELAKLLKEIYGEYKHFAKKNREVAVKLNEHPKNPK